MKKVILAFVLVSLTSLSMAQTSEVRSLEPFKEISLAGSGTVYLTIGSEQKVELKGKSETLSEIETIVKGEKLIIRRKGSGNWLSWDNNDDFEVYITVKKIDELSVAGSGKIIGNNKINADKIEMDVSGSGRMEMELDANQIDVSISGSGKMSLSGKGKDLKINISGSGSVDSENLEVENCITKISGSGRCTVNASKSIDASISGSGSVYYKGDPDKVNSSASGSGKVKKL